MNVYICIYIMHLYSSFKIKGEIKGERETDTQRESVWLLPVYNANEMEKSMNFSLT